MKLPLLVLNLVFSYFIVGCVSASKYDADVSSLHAQVDNDKGLLTKNKAELDKFEAENRALKAELSKLEQRLVTSTKDRGQLQSTLDEMKKALEEMRQRQAEQRKRIREFQDLTKRFKSLTDGGAISVKIIDGKMVVSLGTDVLFPSGSARLSAAGIETIKEVTKQLAAIQDKRFQIEGHTDNVPIATSTYPSNWELASARALNVVRSMMDSGMPPERVSAASYGDTKPIKGNETQEGKAANRRIAIVVVPDLSSLPGYDELNKIGADN